MVWGWVVDLIPFSCLFCLQPRANEPTNGGNSVKEGQMTDQIGVVLISDGTTHQKQGIKHQEMRFGGCDFCRRK
jgi:hypothetical protein